MKASKRLKKLTASALAVAMAAGTVSPSVLAVSGSQIAEDGVYSGKGMAVTDEPDDWDSYSIDLKVTVQDGKIAALEIANQAEIEDTGNWSYAKRALEGKGSKVGIAAQVTGLEASADGLGAAAIDTVSGATCSSKGILDALKAALESAPEKKAPETEAPETQAPETEAPETEAPETQAPETEAPETEAPETQAPETEAPEAQAPETEAPETEAPETEAPETEAPETEAPETEAPETEAPEAKTVYVEMNVPYADFYEAEISNDTAVDAVSSATTNKSTKFPNTYFEQTEAGVTIKGITAAVAMDEAVYNEVKDLVSDSTADYFISEVYEEVPAVYKEMTYADGDYDFGKAKGEEIASTGEAELKTSTAWGDYQLDFEETLTAENVYGVFVTTTDGTSYGMRHEENIWSMRGYSELAWSAGIKTTEPHGNTLNYAHYESMMGKTIDSVTWICTDGIRAVDLTDLYVPIKLAATVSVEDAEVPAGTTQISFSEELPADYEAVYEVEGLEISVNGSELSYEGAAPGSYTLTVSDASGKYAPISASFILSTEEMPAAYDADAIALKAAEGKTEEAFAAYLKNITAVKVGETSYNASGKRSVKIVKEDGAIDLAANNGSIFAEDGVYSLVVTSAGYPELAFDVTVETVYAIMNIPYADFYKAEINNETEVDAVSSATTNKSTKFPNTYFEQTEAGVTIKGIKTPVAMASNVYNAVKDLVTDETADYYISEVLEAAPAVSKKMTYADGVYSFAKAAGEAVESTDETVELKTSTAWGDYQLNLTETLEAEAVYGAFVTTTDGTSYGMRHEENIWSMRGYSELAWSAGIKTTEPHGNTLNYAHYASTMGKTLATVTWICADGIHTVDIADQYVPVKFEGTLTVENAAAPAGTTTFAFSGEMPADFEAVYAVEGLEIAVNGSEISYEGAMPGTYTLTVSDASGKYADLSASFVLSTEEMPAVYDADAKALKAAEGVSEEAFANYLKNVSSVKVGENSYNASGKRSVKIIKEDGAIDMEAKSGENAIFESCQVYDMTVNAAGYPELSFELDTHTYGEGVVVKEATATEDGEMQYTCTECGHTRSEVIPATGEVDKPETPDQPETPEEPETPDQDNVVENVIKLHVQICKWVFNFWKNLFWGSR